MPDAQMISTVSSGTTIVLGAGFAVQRLLEIFDQPLSKLWPDAAKKKFATALIASAVGVLIAYAGGLSILFSSLLKGWPRVIDVLVTGLAIGAGTEGVNSALKLAAYSKDVKKDALRPAEAARSFSPPANATAAKAVAVASP